MVQSLSREKERQKRERERERERERRTDAKGLKKVQLIDFLFPWVEWNDWMTCTEEQVSHTHIYTHIHTQTHTHTHTQSQVSVNLGSWGPLQGKLAYVLLRTWFFSLILLDFKCGICFTFPISVTSPKGYMWPGEISTLIKPHTQTQTYTYTQTQTQKLFDEIGHDEQQFMSQEEESWLRRREEWNRIEKMWSNRLEYVNGTLLFPGIGFPN